MRDDLWRRWSAKLLLLMAALVFAAGAGEVAVRVIRGPHMVLFPRFHSKAVYGEYTLRRLRPNTVFWHTSIDGHWRFTTNAKGLRNARDIPYNRSAGRVRVLTIGDSNTEGFEVDQDSTFSAVTERWLTGRGAPADVINAGISGFGTAEALAYLENEGGNYHPDVVVYGLFANDFEDNARSGLFRLQGESLTVAAKRYAPAVKLLDILNAIPPLSWLSQHSYLYSLAFNTGWDWFKRADVRRAHEGDTQEYTQATRSVGAGDMRLMAALLARMSRFCRTHGILFIVIDIPAWVDRGPGGGPFVSSIPPELMDTVRLDADVLLSSYEVFERFAGTTGLHVAHGQHHISAFSHRVLGERVGQLILDRRAACDTTAGLQLCEERRGGDSNPR